jgi:hypothetical protein
MVERVDPGGKPAAPASAAHDLRRLLLQGCVGGAELARPVHGTLSGLDSVVNAALSALGGGAGCSSGLVALCRRCWQLVDGDAQSALRGTLWIAWDVLGPLFFGTECSARAAMHPLGLDRGLERPLRWRRRVQSLLLAGRAARTVPVDDVWAAVLQRAHSDAAGARRIVLAALLCAQAQDLSELVALADSVGPGLNLGPALGIAKAVAASAAFSEAATAAAAAADAAAAAAAATAVAERLGVVALRLRTAPMASAGGTSLAPSADPCCLSSTLDAVYPAGFAPLECGDALVSVGERLLHSVSLLAGREGEELFVGYRRRPRIARLAGESVLLQVPAQLGRQFCGELAVSVFRATFVPYARGIAPRRVRSDATAVSALAAVGLDSTACWPERSEGHDSSSEDESCEDSAVPRVGFHGEEETEDECDVCSVPLMCITDAQAAADGLVLNCKDLRRLELSCAADTAHKVCAQITALLRTDPVKRVHLLSAAAAAAAAAADPSSSASPPSSSSCAAATAATSIGAGPGAASHLNRGQGPGPAGAPGHAVGHGHGPSAAAVVASVPRRVCAPAPYRYDAVAEYRRQGVERFPFLEMMEQPQYKLCATYPRVLVLPRASTQAERADCAAFRSMQRFPVVTFMLERTGRVLARCAQPLTGLLNATSSADQRLVSLLMNHEPAAEPEASMGKASAWWEPQPRVVPAAPAYLIMDARSFAASMGNQMLGKGTETPSNYPGCAVQFHNIDNIHALRASWLRLSRLVLEADEEGDFLRAAADTGWLRQVRSVLEAGCQLASSLETTSVLTHCSDGWDRTAQMTGLAMLLLDPFFRTGQGFAVLVDKEWCSFGHKFRDRVFSSGEESAPVFLLWVDCVWQVQRQFPSAFQFNSRFLVALLEHLFAGRFANFLFNSEKEAQDQLAASAGHVRFGDLWDHMLADRSLMNATYRPTNLPLRPRLTTNSVQLWIEYYFRHHRI